MLATLRPAFPTLFLLSIILVAALPWIVHAFVRNRGRFATRSWLAFVAAGAVLLVLLRREWLQLVYVIEVHPTPFRRLWEMFSAIWLKVGLVSTLALMLLIDWRLIQRERMRM